MSPMMTCWTGRDPGWEVMRIVLDRGILVVRPSEILASILVVTRVENLVGTPPGTPAEIVNLSGIRFEILYEIEIPKEKVKVNPLTWVLGGPMGRNHCPLRRRRHSLGGSPRRIRHH